MEFQLEKRIVSPSNQHNVRDCCRDPQNRLYDPSESGDDKMVFYCKRCTARHIKFRMQGNQGG